MKNLKFVSLCLILLTAISCSYNVNDVMPGEENILAGATWTSYDLERAYFIGGYFSLGAYDTRTDTITKSADGRYDAPAALAIDSLKRHGWAIQNFEAKGNVSYDIFELDSQYLLAKKTENGKNIYVVAFRGTQGILRDWFGSDFDAFAVKFFATGTRVHRGFLQYTMPAYNNATLNNMIQTLKLDPNAHIIVTGHSLGGAAALIYSAMLVERGVAKAKINCITFGQPAVGLRFSGFESRYETKFNNYTRFVRVGDAVVVAASPFYTHFGTKIQEYGSINPVTAHDKKLYKDMAKKNAPNYARFYGAD